jgi:hypothetical protein
MIACADSVAIVGSRGVVVVVVVVVNLLTHPMPKPLNQFFF